MKKLLVLFILLTIFSSGCIFNLDNWVTPDDAEFLALVQELDTPEKICQYMIDNFTYKENIFSNPSPYQLWLQKKGDCNDFATFAIFIANYHNYITYQIHIYSNCIFAKHIIPVFVENGYLLFFDFPCYFYDFFDFNTFSEIMDFYREYIEWSKYIVYDYDMNIVEQIIR